MASYSTAGIKHKQRLHLRKKSPLRVTAGLQMVLREYGQRNRRIYSLRKMKYARKTKNSTYMTG